MTPDNTTDTDGTERRLKEIQGDVWLTGGLVLAVLAHMFPPGDPVVAHLAMVGALLCGVVALVRMLETNPFFLPVLRLIGREEWSYHHTPLEEGPA